MNAPTVSIIGTITLIGLALGPAVGVEALRPQRAEAAPARAPNGGATDARCQIQITNPSQGAKVGKKVLVEGTARMPPGATLVGFVEIDGIWGYWIQGPARVHEDGSWRVLSHIGGPDDIGSNFTVHIAAVDAQNAQVLRNLLREQTARHNWEPIETFPNVIPGCAIRELRLIKTSHQ
jgi:hypothetical protein